MKLNIGTALRKEQERLAKPKPLTLKMKGKALPTAELATTNEQRSTNNPIESELEAEMIRLKKERAKLSTRTAFLVLEVEAKVRAQVPAVADEIIKGHLPMPELREHAAAIQNYTDQIIAKYDELQHVKRFGKMPEPEAKSVTLPANYDVDAAAIKHEVRRLDDLIYKKKKTLAKVNGSLAGPLQTKRVQDYKEVIALADAKRFELKEKLKRMNYGTRG